MNKLSRRELEEALDECFGDEGNLRKFVEKEDRKCQMTLIDQEDEREAA